MRAYLKPTLYILCSLTLLNACYAATMFNITDGWDGIGGDDTYASGEDNLTISFGSTLDSQYSIEATDTVDTYCVRMEGLQKAHTYLMASEVLPSIPIWGYGDVTDAGITWSIQPIGGTQTLCRFHLWKDKACNEWFADGAGLDYSPGCEPDEIDYNLAEGATDTITVGGDSVDVTCLAAGVHKYVKCQAPTYAQLSDCRQSSLDEDNGGDSFRLYDACTASETSSADSEEICDVIGANSWEISIFGSDQLTDEREKLYLRGIPNIEFSLVAYTGCGGATFDRTVISSFNLTQFNSKSRVCDGYDYSMVGNVTNYLPWFQISDYNDYSFTYANNSCDLGEICSENLNSTDDFAPDASACYVENGTSCYDHVMNQDEFQIDYGGVCGNCTSGVDKISDTFWLVAVESNPRGFFGISEPFDSDTYCEAAESNVGFLMYFLIILYLAVFLLGIILFFSIVAPMFGFFIIPFIKSLRGKKSKK